MDNIMIFDTDCDYIADKVHDDCIECYRYDTCKAYFDKQNSNG